MMQNLLQKQYSLVRDTRQLVLDFLENEVKEDVNTPVPALDNKTTSYLLKHTACCYFYWLGHYTLQQPLDKLENEQPKTIPLIREHFTRVDSLVAFFLHKFEDKWEVEIDGTFSGNPFEHPTPLQILTHVITHEFHHKGQIANMCRMLGHIPPDTDLSNSFIVKM